MTNKQFSRRTKFMSQKQWLYEAVRGKIQKSSYVVIRYVSGASPGRLAGCGLKQDRADMGRPSKRITRPVSRVRIETRGP